ncbi:hypothetical protein [Riemerella columbina]|uniref:hypothetical protein n=1 Tax=Riemerella columbina TaxID=103810 RepID=UPI00266E908C|nr:hypothetical protein [Riemerella columbina]WKS95685.1 hypothetical protein NYR17_02785 [Riemerella columbina]
MKNISLFLSIGFLFFGCNERVQDLPDEDYNTLFPNKGKIDVPDIDYINMVPSICDPKENELNFQYPGVDISGPHREYTVTLKYSFSEEHLDHYNYSRSLFDIKYITPEKTLATLRSYNENGQPAQIENGQTYEIQFKVKSGYPLYLSVDGAGYDVFKMNASIQAKSDDGIVVTPILKYETSLYTDGYSELAPYCEKIILP